MKTYFAKYLSVEGEIKEGDFVQDSMGVYQLTSFEGVKVNKEIGRKKVKLFLCSRDTGNPIGEVSIGAKWVREDMEFSNEDILLDFIHKKFPDESSTGWKLNDKNLPAQSDKHRQVVRIKCSCCDTFT